MVLKYRSRVDYAQIYNGDKQGYNLGLDGAIFLKTELVPRTFQPMSIGTQGESVGGTTPSTDISAGSDVNLKVAVDGGAVANVALNPVGASTGDAIAAELETKINAALSAAGQDGRVWARYETDHYEVISQKTGLASSVVITDGDTDNVADDLKLGVANMGTETVGTDDTDFLLYTTGGPTFSQPIESNAHRSGRFHSGIIRQKKVAEFSFQTYVNMSGTAGDSLDAAIRLLWKSLLGKEVVVSGQEIRYEQDLPIVFMSLARVSTIFAEYYTGAYVKDATLNFNGDSPATMDWSGMASTRVIAGIAKTVGAVVASASVTTVDGQAERYDPTAPVMAVSPDGRTIVAGADGLLKIDAVDLTGTKNGLTLSAAIDLEDGGYIVPWHPGAVQQTGRDNIYTDLEGSFKLRSSVAEIDISSAALSFTNDHIDLNSYFGRSANQGFVAGNRMTMNLSVTFDLSNENFADIVQSSKFEGFTPVIRLGETTSRYMQVEMSKWIPAVPAIEVPENGTTPITLEGNLLESSPGARDPIKVRYL